MRRLAALAVTATLAATGLTACSDDGDTPDEPTVTATPHSPSPTESESPTATTGSAKPDNTPPKVVGTVAGKLSVPWGIAFLPNGDAVVTERDSGRVLLIQGPDHLVHPVGEIRSVGGAGSESGLMGVAVSPTYDADRTLYFYLTTATDNRIIKVPVTEDGLGAQTVLLDGIPRGPIHDGGRLAFGPDGYLYASTGETGQGDLAQDKGTPAGKILRITTDGDPAPGNPFPGSPIWSLGHRNVQGLAFDDADRLWASEFGANLFDELNLIKPGRNYGWPIVEGRGERKGLVDPQVVWSTDEASPSGLAWLDGHLWLASLRGQRLWRIDVKAGKASNPRDFFVGEYGRMRAVVAAPDGRLWVSTSNRDGRGSPSEDDDRILIVEP